jgi:hypothetical protein
VSIWREHGWIAFLSGLLNGIALACLVAFALMHCTGCAARPTGPTAIIRLHSPGEWSHGDLVSVEEGLAAWRSLGFVTSVEKTSQLPPCPNNWAAQGLTDCVLVIGLSSLPGMMVNHKARGWADRVTDTIAIDSIIGGSELVHVIAHEVGHILLNTSKHTTHGVMNSGGWMRNLSAKDRALACETIGRGCQ